MDEADRLLDMGFKRDLDSIMSFLPQGQSFTHPRSTLTTCPLIPRVVLLMTRPLIPLTYTSHALPLGQSFTHPRSTLTTSPLIPLITSHHTSSHTICFAARSVIHTSSLNPHDMPSHPPCRPPHDPSSHTPHIYLSCFAARSARVVLACWRA